MELELELELEVELELEQGVSVLPLLEECLVVNPIIRFYIPQLGIAVETLIAILKNVLH